MSFTLKGKQIWLEDRMLGWITTTMDGKKVFVSPRKKSHYFRNFKGYGVSEQLLEFLEQNLFDQIHLRIGKRKTLISNLTGWREHGQPYRHQKFEAQIILPEKHMKKKMLSLSEVME